MKKSWLLLFVFALCTQIMTAQSEIGLKFGVSSYDLPDDALELDQQQLRIAIEDASYGIHFGAYLRLGLLGFQIQPELIFNSNSVSYRVTDIEDEGTVGQIRTESYQNIDIPVLIMFSPSILRLYAGPVGHYFLNSVSELKNIEGFKDEFKTLTFGYQAGAGVQIGGIWLDVRYEGNLSRFGDHINIDGHPYPFSKSPARILFSLGLKL